MHHKSMDTTTGYNRDGQKWGKNSGLVGVRVLRRAMRDQDWLERPNFSSRSEDSGANPFLREHLPPKDIPTGARINNAGLCSAAQP